MLTGYLIINNKYEMETIEETRRQVDREIKMMKQTPRISDKSKFLNQKIISQGKHQSLHKSLSHQIFIYLFTLQNIKNFKSYNPHQNK